MSEAPAIGRIETRAHPRRRARDGRRGPVLVLGALGLALIGAALIAATIGPASIPLPRLLAALGLAEASHDMLARDQLILWSIRMPRIALAALVAGCSPRPAP